MGWDDELVIKDVGQLIEKSILGGVMPPCLGITAALPPILTPPPGLEPRLPNILRAVLEFAVADTGNKYLRAAKACLGLKSEAMSYDELWDVVKSSSELEYGRRASKDEKPEAAVAEEDRQKAQKKLAQRVVIREMLAMREIVDGTPGSSRGFKKHFEKTRTALKNSIHVVLSDEDKVQEIANLCKLPSGREQKGVRHEPDAHAAIDGSDPVDEERLEPLAFEQVPIVPPNPVRRQRTIILGDHPRKPKDFVESSKAGKLNELASGAGVMVIRGQRGAGKTQLAAQYWRVCRAAGWELLAWVNAEDSDVLLSGLSLVMEGLGVEDRSQDLQASARTLRDILERRDEPALLVLDNAIDVDLVKSAVPECGETRILITTTNAAFERLGPYLRVDGFTEPEAIAYLRQWTGRTDDEGARAVADELGWLPLALAQVGAMIREHRLTYDEYLELLREEPVMELLGSRSEGDDYPRSTAAAILLSIESVESGDTSELGGQVLRLVALLGSPSVRRDFLYAALAAPDERSRLVVDTAIARCVRASLLDWSEDSTSLIMHRLVARVLRERTQRDGSLADTVEAALRLIDILKVPTKEAWTKRAPGDELARHVETLSRRISDWNGFDATVRVKAGEVQKWAADQLRKTSDPLRAVQVGRLGLDNLWATVGDNDPRVWDCYRTVGWSYLKAQRWDEGLELLESMGEAIERTEGRMSLEAIKYRKDLAASYRDAGRYGESETLLMAVKSDAEAELGYDSEIAVSVRSNLAYYFQQSGKRKEAIPIYREVLRDRERLLGSGHPKTRWSKQTLASAYHAAGDYKRAIELFRQCLEDYGDDESLASEREADQTSSRENLAYAFLSNRQPQEAIPLLEQSIQVRSRALSPHQPKLIKARIGLAEAYESTGTYALAIEQWQLVASAREAALGPDNSDTRWAVERLAVAQAEHDRQTEGGSNSEEQW